MLIAILDSDNVFKGAKDVDSVGDHDIILPDNYDLVADEFRWNAKAKTFDHLVVGTTRRHEPEIPKDAMFAIAAGFAALSDSGVKLPDVTIDWLGWYLNSFDALGCREASKRFDIYEGRLNVPA